MAHTHTHIHTHKHTRARARALLGMVQLCYHSEWTLCLVSVLVDAGGEASTSHTDSAPHHTSAPGTLPGPAGLSSSALQRPTNTLHHSNSADARLVSAINLQFTGLGVNGLRQSQQCLGPEAVSRTYRHTHTCARAHTLTHTHTRALLRDTQGIACCNARQLKLYQSTLCLCLCVCVCVPVRA